MAAAPAPLKMPARRRNRIEVSEINPVTSPLDEQAIRIQRAWRRTLRHAKTKNLVVLYLKMGPTRTSVLAISFDALVVFLRDPNVVAVTRRCLRRVDQGSILRHRIDSPPRTEINTVRKFLAAYMIVHRPDQVFEQIGMLEKTLSDVSNRMLAVFESILECVAGARSLHDVPVELTLAFPDLMSEYFVAFDTWKTPDETKVSKRIRRALVALHSSDDELPANDTSPLKMEIVKQIKKLRAKYVQISGPEALTQFDEMRGNASRKDSAKNLFDTPLKHYSKVELSHQLLINPAFRIPDSVHPEDQSSHERIRALLDQCKLNSMEDDLSLDVPCFSRLFSVLDVVRNRLLEAAAEQESVKATINEVLNMDLIKKKDGYGLFAWDDCKALIGSVVDIIRRVQAPKRTDELKILRDCLMTEMDVCPVHSQTAVFCKGLKFLSDRTHLLSIDDANASILTLTPMITKCGMDWERDALQRELDGGTLTLARTEAWIHAVTQQLFAQGILKFRQSAQEGSVVRESVSKHCGSIHLLAVISLITDQAVVINPETIPETLRMDGHYLLTIQKEYARIVSGTVMLVMATEAIIGRDRDPPKEKREVLAALQSLVVNERDHTHVCADFFDELKTVLPDFEERKKLVDGILAVKDDPKSRIRQHVALCVTKIWKDTAGGQPTSKFVASASVVLPLIHAAVRKMSVLVGVNLRTYRATYERIICDAIEKRAK